MMRNAAVVGFATVAMAAAYPSIASIPVYPNTTAQIATLTPAASHSTDQIATLTPANSHSIPVYPSIKSETQTVFTTFCPSPTTLTHIPGTTIIVSTPTTLTITKCKDGCHYPSSTDQIATLTPAASHSIPVYPSIKSETQTVFTTFCPSPTTLTHIPGTTIIVSTPTTLTITKCKDGCHKPTGPADYPPVHKTTEAHTVLTTYCPEPTTLTFGTKIITVTEATTLTAKVPVKTTTIPVYKPETKTEVSTLTTQHETTKTASGTTETLRTVHTFVTTKSVKIPETVIRTETIPAVEKPTTIVQTETVKCPECEAKTSLVVHTKSIPAGPAETKVVTETKMTESVYIPTTAPVHTEAPVPTVPVAPVPTHNGTQTHVSPPVYTGAASAFSAAGVMAAVGAVAAFAL